MVDQEGQTSNWNDKELNSESVVVPIISGLEFHIDQVHSGIGAADVDDLHACVVEGYEGGEEIQVACCENQGKEYLALPRDSCAGPGFPYFQQQDDDSR